MNRILSFCICFYAFCGVLSAFAGSPMWLWERDNLALEKEQLYHATIQVGNVEKELQFRWTLYKNAGLVMHIRYDTFNHQALLYTDYQRNAFSFPLGRGLDVQREGDKDRPQFFIYFKDFKDKKALFHLYIHGLGAMVLNEVVAPSPKNTESNDTQDLQEENNG